MKCNYQSEDILPKWCVFSHNPPKALTSYLFNIVLTLLRFEFDINIQLNFLLFLKVKFVVKTATDFELPSSAIIEKEAKKAGATWIIMDRYPLTQDFNQ